MRYSNENRLAAKSTLKVYASLLAYLLLCSTEYNQEIKLAANTCEPKVDFFTGFCTAAFLR